MQKKILLTLALVLSMAKLYAAKEKHLSTQPSPIKIGYVHVGYLLDYLPEIKTIESELRSFDKQLKKQLEAKSDEFQKKFKVLQEGYEAMTEAVRNKKQLELEQLTESFTQLQRESQEKLANKSADLFGPIQNKIRQAIEQVAKKNGYTHILNSGPEPFPTLLYGDEKYNISDLVLRELGVDPAEVKSKK
jgi:outer membrane protein